MTKCPYCPRSMRDNAAVSRHVSQTKACREARLAKLNVIKQKNRRVLMQIDLNGNQNAPMQVDEVLGGGLDGEMDDGELLNIAAEEVFQDAPEPQNAPLAPPPPPPRAPPVPDPQEVFTVPYGRNAGAPVNDVKRLTHLEQLATKYPLDEKSAEFGPFNSEKEWDFAEVCAKTLGHGELDTLLKLDFVSAD